MNQYQNDFNEKASDYKPEMSLEDKRLVKMAENSITLLDGHYSLNLPFKKDDTVMPDNLHIAEQRLSSLKRKFLRNELF